MEPELREDVVASAGPLFHFSRSINEVTLRARRVSQVLIGERFGRRARYTKLAQLGDERFDELWEQGAARDLSSVISELLAD